MGLPKERITEMAVVVLSLYSVAIGFSVPAWFTKTKWTRKAYFYAAALSFGAANGFLFGMGL